MRRPLRLVTVRAILALLAIVVVSIHGQVPTIPLQDWPQFGRDPQRTGYTPLQVDPPYCYAWKWYEVPIPNRAQPVVAGGRLFVGSMDGVLYARDATTGGPLWQFATGGPIRHSAAIAGALVIVGSHDGNTYAVDASNGAVRWTSLTGPTATAPLVDAAAGRVYVASTTGLLTALDSTTGGLLWQFQAGAPILTSPALTADGATVIFGTEAIEAIGVSAATGAERWRRTLQGQSLADRSPVVVGSAVIFRSEPYYFFHTLLHEGDDVMDQAGPLQSDWTADWNAVRPRILNYLTSQPTKQTIFLLDAASGASLGVLPVLYTYGNNDTPAQPVARGSEVYLPYRARHGIQNDGGAVHVSSRYDAELGRLDLSTRDITGLRHSTYPQFSLEFRLTSDEAAALTMAGDLLLVDNWERLGGLNVRTGALFHISAVSNDWPECYAQCGPGTSNPFFPMAGTGTAYPFPSPRVTEGHVRSGAVVANNMVYWRVIEGGLGALYRRSGATCPAPQVWTGGPAAPRPPEGVRVLQTQTSPRPFSEYVTLDLTEPAAAPPSDLVTRLREEVRNTIAPGSHLMPFYVERGHSFAGVWPRATTNPPGPPQVSYGTHGNAFWYDPGELLYTMAMAYPYLDAQLKADVRSYMAAEMQRYPPLDDLPWYNQPWLKQGAARELSPVPFRDSLNNWPPPAANLASIYALWLWSKNTGDLAYASSVWSRAKSLFAARKNSMTYYADIAGAIGYARLARMLGDTAAATEGTQVAVQAMTAGLDFNSFQQRAQNEYIESTFAPAGGWYLPVFFGLTPEVGLYLREHLWRQSLAEIHARQERDGLRWWYLTRAGGHAEGGESSFVLPTASWSHFLARAYIVGDSQRTLRRWLDRPWARGDLYSIQKLVATLQADP